MATSTMAPVVETEAQEDEFASVNSVLLSSILLILMAIGYRINTHKLRHLPESGAAMGLGFLLGIMVRLLGLAQEEQLLNFKGGLFFYVLLPPIIFEAGLSLETQLFVDNVGAICSFAVIGTLVSAWVTSSGLRMLAASGAIGLDSSSPRLAIQCHLFGALIAATDPVATIALFGSRRIRADPLLHSLINGESVLNDAVAIALFSTLADHMDEENPSLFSPAVLTHFFVISAFSVLLGLAAGALCSWCFNSSKHLMHFPHYEIAAMFLSAYLTFAVSQLMGLSGIVALFFFGVVLRQYNYYNLSDRSQVATEVSFGTLAKLAESCVFIYLGAVAALSVGRLHWHFGLVCYTCILIVIARAAHIFPLTAMLNVWRDKKIGQNLSITMWISGLRGAIAFALSLRLPCASGNATRHGTDECRNSDLLVTTTISIVMITTLIVGSSMEYAMTALGVIETLPAGAAGTSGSHSPGELARQNSCSSLEAPLAGTEDSVAHHRLQERWMPRAGISRNDEAKESSFRAFDDQWEGEPFIEGRVRMGSLGGTRSLWNARGWVYQAFARFDLNHLQPILGGPRERQLEASRDVELPALSTPSTTAPSAVPSYMMEEDPPPACSRAAIFE